MEYLIGIIIGGLLGLTGAGGSLCAVPLLILLLDLPPAEAMGIALGAVAASALFGVLRQARSILWFPGLVLAVSGVLMAPLGRLAAFSMPDTILMSSFCLLALLISRQLWRQASQDPEATSVVRASSAEAKHKGPLHFCAKDDLSQYRLTRRCFIGLLGGGLVIGFLSGLYGVGGGFLIVPYLFFLGAISLQVAIATSLFIITLVSGSGFLSYLSLSTNLDYALLVKIVVAGTVGMLMSQRFSALLSGVYLQKAFAVILILLSTVMLTTVF